MVKERVKQTHSRNAIFDRNSQNYCANIIFIFMDYNWESQNNALRDTIDIEVILNNHVV